MVMHRDGRPEDGGEDGNREGTMRGTSAMMSFGWIESEIARCRTSGEHPGIRTRGEQLEKQMGIDAGDA
jgi:hypothetical protein